MLFFVFFFMICSLFFYTFNSKLNCLLTLEFLMLFLIFFSFFSFFGTSVFSVFCPMLFSCFMVLDSVLGISIMIGSFRGSSLLNCNFSQI